MLNVAFALTSRHFNLKHLAFLCCIQSANDRTRQQI
jgi:hypothetical protein